MKSVSRRKFIKGVLAVAALLPLAKTIKNNIAMQDKVVLAVDKEGNATLCGMTLALDEKNNANVM